MCAEAAINPYAISGSVFKIDCKNYSNPNLTVSNERKCLLNITRYLEDDIEFLNNIRNYKEAEQKDIYLLLLNDSSFKSELIKNIQSGISALESLCSAYKAVGQKFSVIGKIAEKREEMIDFSELAYLIEDAMMEFCDLEEFKSEGELIIVVRNISLKLLNAIDPDMLAAVVCEKESANSHAVIYLRTLGVPTILGVENIFDKVENDDQITIDFYNSGVYAKDYTWSYDKDKKIIRNDPSHTGDGSLIKLKGTINAAGETEKLHIYTTDGIGFVRTELLFIRTKLEPSVFRQSLVYSGMTQWYPGEDVVFRLFDFKDDKTYWNKSADKYEIYERQLKALLNASVNGKLNILIPMCESAEDIIKIRELVKKLLKDFDFDCEIKIGAMIESVRSVHNREEIMKLSDFVYIGTNDLSADSLNVKRSEVDVGTIFFEPVFLRNLFDTACEAHKQNIQMTVCGEMIRSKECVYILAGMGIDCFSVTIKRIPVVREFVRKVDSKHARKNIKRILQMKSFEEVNCYMIDEVVWFSENE